MVVKPMKSTTDMDREIDAALKQPHPWRHMSPEAIRRYWQRQEHPWRHMSPEAIRRYWQRQEREVVLVVMLVGVLSVLGLLIL
ncbi:MAG: hypothetical protein ACYTEX_25565 [Planctomycetota bacterium]